MRSTLSLVSIVFAVLVIAVDVQGLNASDSEVSVDWPQHRSADEGAVAPESAVQPYGRAWFAADESLCLRGGYARLSREAEYASLAATLRQRTASTGVLVVATRLRTSSTAATVSASALTMTTAEGAVVASIEQRGTRWMLRAGALQRAWAEVGARDDVVLAVQAGRVSAWCNGHVTELAVPACDPRSLSDIWWGRTASATTAWRGFCDRVVVAHRVPDAHWFAARTLATATMAPAAPVIELEAVLVAKEPPADPPQYQSCIVGHTYRVVSVISGSYAPRTVQVYHWWYLNGESIGEVRQRTIGGTYRLHLIPRSAIASLNQVTTIDSPEHDNQLDLFFDPGF